MNTSAKLILLSGILFLLLSIGCSNNNQPYCCEYNVTVQGTLNNDVKIPNVITPNGDGQNDNFWIDGVANTNASLFIYDQSQNLVYFSPNYYNQFTGLDNAGSALPEGNYRALLLTPTGNAEVVLTLIRSQSLTGSCANDCKPRDPNDQLLLPI